MIDFGKSVASAAQQLRVRSALNPMLWLTGIVSPFCLMAAYAFRDVQTISWALIGVAVIPVVVTCFGFAYFAVTKPEKLQSEEYQLRHETLQIIQQKTGQLLVDPTSLAAIANPAVRALPPTTGGNE